MPLAQQRVETARSAVDDEDFAGDRIATAGRRDSQFSSGLE